MRTFAAFLLLAVIVSCSPQQTNELDAEPVISTGHPALNVLIIADVRDHATLAQLQPGQLLSSVDPSASIGPGVQASVRSMQSFFRRASAATKLPLNMYLVGDHASPDDFNCSHINETIKNFPVMTGDVVVVYYAGHGFQPNKTGSTELYTDPTEIGPRTGSRMPYLWCGSYVEDPNAAAVARWVSVKSPRLVVVMADACNSYLYEKPVPIAAAAALPPTAIDERFVGLFVKSSGTVLMTATQPGTYAFYAPSGGKFTSQFLAIFESSDPSVSLSWKDIANKFWQMTQEYQGATYAQLPFAEISANMQP
jgi:hypothetical protein